MPKLDPAILWHGEKRVICLYRVSTARQVDHDDIPMQRKACRAFAAQQPDWLIVEEICEKGVSGYKTSADDRDAIIEIREKAIANDFDILLVFMFDRIGRRDDETPFVVQWLAQKGIEVWSVKEGRQQFSTHLDKLINYLHYWQAAGESLKTSMRVRTRHLQMIREGQYRGGPVPFGYHLKELGRENNRRKPVPDLVIDEAEACIVRQIVSLVTQQGYGMHRIANWLNEQKYPTKRGKGLWCDTSVYAMLRNPIYIGMMRFGSEQAGPFENLRILDDEQYRRCLEIIEGRSHRQRQNIPLRTDTKGLLSGMIYCAACGGRLVYNHNVTQKRLADGTIKEYTRDQYRCYRRQNQRSACNGPASYEAGSLHDMALSKIRSFFRKIRKLFPEDALQQLLQDRRQEAQQAFDAAQMPYGGSRYALELVKHQWELDAEGKAELNTEMLKALQERYIQEAEANKRRLLQTQNRLQDEEALEKLTREELMRMIDWAQRFEWATDEEKHMILSALIERIDVGPGDKVKVRYQPIFEQFRKLKPKE